MKNLMRIMSVLLLFAGIIFTTVTIFDIGDDFNLFAIKIILIFIANIMSFISLAACAYCLERNDNNYLARIIPIYVSIPIVLSIIIVFFNVTDDFTTKALAFFVATSLSISLYSITMIVKPNNQISSIMKYIAIFSIIVCGIINVINVFDQSTISINSINVNLSVLSSAFKDFDSIKDLIYSASTIIEIFSILLLFTTNYAFSSSIILEDGDIDYEAVKKDAMSVVNKQMNERYNLDQPKEEQKIVQNSSNNNGMMNINNQLGINSNVGNVKEKAKEVNVEESLDAIMSFSTGPVVNNTIENNTPKGIQNNNQNNTQINQENNIQNNTNTTNQNANSINQAQMQQNNIQQNQVNNQNMQQTVQNNMNNQNIQQPVQNNINNQVPNQVNNNQNKFLN